MGRHRICSSIIYKHDKYNTRELARKDVIFQPFSFYELLKFHVYNLEPDSGFS